MENKTGKKTPMQFVLNLFTEESLRDLSMQFVLNLFTEESLGDLSGLLLTIEKESRKNDLLNMMQKIFKHLNSSSQNDISNFDFEKYIEENT